MKLASLASLLGILLCFPSFSFADIEVEKDAAREKVYLLRTKQAPFAIQAVKSANQSVNYSELANKALTDYAYKFGVQDTKQELKLSSIDVDDLNMVHLRYKQVLHNIPVLSGELIVHLKSNGTLKSITGNFVTGLTISTEPLFSQADAYNVAADYWTSTLNYGSNYRPNASKLVIISPSEQNNQDGVSFLAWMISLSDNSQTSPKDLNIYVNADNGEIITSDSNVRGQDIYREVWDKDSQGNYVLDVLDSTNNYYIGRSEGKAARGVNPYTDIAPDRVYDRLKLAHEFANDVLSIDGANNAGGVLVEDGKSITRAYLDKNNCPSNAGYSSSTKSFSFCGTSKLVQLLGHEYGHAIVDGALTYAGESGGLEEAWADINSYAFEAYLNGEASWVTETQTSSEKPARYSKDPTSSLAVKKYPKDWYASDFTKAEVCNNIYAISTIPTYAAYLAAEGGTFNDCKTFPIGINKVHKIWHRAVKNYFPSNVTMNAAVGYLLNACDDLYPNPTNGNDLSTTCYQLKKALLAVKMDQVGICLDPERLYNKTPRCKFCNDDGGVDCDDVDADGDGTPDSADECPNDPEKVSPGRCGCNVPEIIEDNDGDGFYGGNSCPAIRNDCNDSSYNATKPGSTENCSDGKDNDCDGLIDNNDPDCSNSCPDDPNKTEPGICGCGVPDIDTDGDGTYDCIDGCPQDPDKTAPGKCGCGEADIDSDNDGVADCNDECPTDPKKTEAGVCGCFVPDVDLNGNSTIDCNDSCKTNRNGKKTAGACGCGTPDTDSDGDGAPDCLDGCPNNPNLIAPKGLCGCIDDESNSCNYVCTGVNNRYMGGSESHLNFPMNLYSEPGYDGNVSSTSALKGAGDINGDGFEDIVIGYSAFGRAYTTEIIDDVAYETVSNEGTGKVIIYFGSSEGIDQNSSYELVGTASSLFGKSIASNFDINGDGYSDLVIATVSNSIVYYGNDTNTLTKGATLPAGSLAAAGDINNDGYDDLIIGQASDNQVSLFYGSGSGIKTTAKVVTLDGTSSLGSVVATAGDINGDGFDDFMASASSSVVVFLGKSSTSGNFTSKTLSADDASEILYGFSIASAGDVNGDGYDDVLVGSPTFNGGNVYLYFGAKTPLKSNVKFDGNTPTNRYVANDPDYTPALFGSSVSSAGDINGDGFSDIIIGSAGNDPFNTMTTKAGAAFLIYGQADKNLLIKNRITGQISSQRLGTFVASAGDVDGDGYDDFLLSSNYAISDTNSMIGLAYGLLYHSGMKREFGDINNNFIPDCAECNSNIKDLPGVCGCSVQDTDSDWDGTPDCVDSCPNNPDKIEPGVCGCAREDSEINVADNDKDGIANCNDLSPNDSSEGRAGLSVVWSRTGSSKTQKLGASVLLADFNGDNIDDIIFSSANGKIEAYYGSTGELSATADWTVTEKASVELALAGDVNGDGYNDLLVGCPLCNSKKGLIKVYYGGDAGLSTTAGLTRNGASASELGSSVAAVDINGDGYPDILAGATGSKKAYLFLNTEGTISSTPITNSIGYVVASAGDIDNDGYGDFLISNPQALSGSGRSYLYYGKKSGSKFEEVIFSGWDDAALGSAAATSSSALAIAAPNFAGGKGFINMIFNDPNRGSYGVVNASWIYGDEATSNFGKAVAFLNNSFADGKEDIVISAPGYRLGRGIVYISPRLSSSQAKFTIYGENNGDLYGSAIAAGDMNGDGFDDLLVTSPSYDSGKGKVELFIGGPKRSPSEKTYIEGGDLNGGSGVGDVDQKPVETDSDPDEDSEIDPKEDPKQDPVCTAEICNGLDDDCDGVVDNGFNVGKSCSSGEGQCLAYGIYACDGKGGVRCMAEPKGASEEVCGNGIDEDCDGSDLDCNILCSDTDGGSTRIKRGIVQYQANDYRDRCLNRKVLIEYSCSSGEANLSLFRCAAGCKAGRCKTRRVLRLTKALKKKQKNMRRKQFGIK